MNSTVQRHRALASSCHEAVLEVFRQATLEFGSDLMVVIETIQEGCSVNAVPRTEIVEGLKDDILKENDLKIILNPAPEGHFYLVIVDSNDTFSCFLEK